jgi:hypothetical protein
MTKSVSFTVLAFVLGFMALLPSLASAQGLNATGVLDIVLNLINFLIRILIVAGIAYFIYGIVKYVIAKGSEDKEEGKKHMINGLIGLFVIIAFWGIIRIVQNTFNLNSSNQLQQQYVPCVQGVNC